MSWINWIKELVCEKLRILVNSIDKNILSSKRDLESKPDLHKKSINVLVWL